MPKSKQTKDIIFINSHPIQYFAPMYKYMNEQGVFTKAWYCSDETLKTSKDEEFGATFKWDIPLLEGYEYHFFKNSSWKPSLKNGFFGLINWGMIRQLFNTSKSIIVVHGWNYFTHFCILMLGKLKGHTVCIRNDMPLSHEYNKKGWKQKVKIIGLKYFLFPRINYFLYIGTENKVFYESYGLNESRLISCPYAVDNDRFASIEKSNSKKIELCIPLADKVILFTAKYIDKKRPLDLIAAFHKAAIQNTWLVMVGEGALRGQMEDYINKHKIKNVLLTGFVNQLEITQYYAMADVFVMCSTYGENWGLSVNEAMNFNLPLILSHHTGCAIDLVQNGVNGYIFPTGDVEDLSEKLQNVLVRNELSWKTSSKKIIQYYSFLTVTEQLKSIATL